MEREFWESRWNEGQIAFHRPEPNVLLVEHIAYFEGAKRIYVPLCGKSVDLAYLRGRGHEVIGTEFVPLAIEQLFAALGETPTVTKRGPYRAHEVKGLTILQGDAFEVTPELLGGHVDMIYDRASMIAVAPATRAQFMETFNRVLSPKGRIAEIVFEYDQTKIDGPPWSVKEEELDEMTAAWGEVRILGSRLEPVSPRMAAAGVTRVLEKFYAIERSPAV